MEPGEWEAGIAMFCEVSVWNLRCGGCHSMSLEVASRSPELGSELQPGQGSSTAMWQFHLRAFPRSPRVQGFSVCLSVIPQLGSPTVDLFCAQLSLPVTGDRGLSSMAMLVEMPANIPVLAYELGIGGFLEEF